MLTLNHTSRLGHVMHLLSVENLEELQWPPVLKVLACVVFVSKHINPPFDNKGLWEPKGLEGWGHTATNLS